MSTEVLVALVVGGAAVALVILLVCVRRGRSPRSTRTQTARIRVKGGYEPSRIVVRAGSPVSLTFRREETAPCSERVIFPDLGKSAMLPPFEEVTVKLPAIEPGEHEFTCQMGVLKGRLIARLDGR